MSTDTIRELTQSIIAILVVAGGGFILYAQPQSSAVPFVASIITAVVTYFFARGNTQSAVNRAVATDRIVDGRVGDPIH